RLPEKSKERELSERTLWLKLNEALKAAKASEHIRVMQVKKTNGGLALTPGPGCKTDELFGQKGTLEKAVDATGSALHEQFDKYVIAKVPTRDGEDEITMDERPTLWLHGARRSPTSTSSETATWFGPTPRSAARMGALAASTTWANTRYRTAQARCGAGFVLRRGTVLNSTRK
ncbi:unnamed protein product, partial [Tilletia caries]